MKVLSIISRIVARIVITWLLLAPVPLIVVYLLDLRLVWPSPGYTILTLWSLPVFALATVIDPAVHGALAMPHYAAIYLALAILFVGVRRWRRARRAARATA